MEFKIYSVGSSDSLSNELKDALTHIFENKIPVWAIRTDEAKNHPDGTLYITQASQQKLLQEYIPAEKIFILNLEPTPKYYLSMASIPAGSDVYFVSTQMPFISRTISACIEMGLDKINYIPVPYAEIPNEETCRMLSKADYITGVDRLLDQELMGNEVFRSCLKPNVKLFGINRVASFQSVCQVINSMNAVMSKIILDKLNGVYEMVNTSIEKQSLYKCFVEVNRIIDNICSSIYACCKDDFSIESTAINHTTGKKVSS